MKSRFFLLIVVIGAVSQAFAQTSVTDLSNPAAGKSSASSAVAGSTPYNTVDTSNVVNACVEDFLGFVRIVSAGTACNTFEQPDSWNIQGVAGPAGAAGAQGPQGVQGSVGPVGPKGATGATGPAGAPGLTGATGATGPAGAVGPMGAAGPMGASGPRGFVGPAGPQGPTGPRGFQGPQGPAGPAGTIPADLTAFSNLLNPNGYTYADFRSSTDCTLGDILLSVNAYGGGGAYVPADGSLLPISQNVALFSVLGTRFGGDGVANFALPDLRSAAPAQMQYSICVFGIFPSRN